MFDWQTEEDEVVWDDETHTPQEEPPKRTIKWWYIALPLLLIGGGYYLYSQIQEQTDTAVSAVEEDILSSHTLLIDSVENQDRDLFELLLSGRDMGWVRAYDDLVREEQFLDYAPFGLTYQSDSYELLNIELTPAFDSAEVEFSLGYLTDENESIRLKQTAVFRPGETRWLYAPPEAEFWGEWRTLEEDEFTFIYTQQDAEWVEAFAEEMNQWLPTLCEAMEQDACAAWEKIIRFDNTPDVKLDYLNVDKQYDAGSQLNVPSPSLIGYPTDEQSERFLMDTYKEMLSRVYVAETLSYDCCVNIVLLDQLMTLVLADFGLTNWSITPEMHYARFQEEESPNLLNLESYWGMDQGSSLSDAERAELQLMIDFVLNLNTDYSAVQLLQSLIEAEFTLGQWLNSVIYGVSTNELRDRNSLSEINFLWEHYATLYHEAETDIPVSMPDETLTLVCNPRDLSAESTQLYQYHFATESWQTIFDREDFAIMFPSGDNSTAVFQHLIFEDAAPPMSEMSIWTDGGQEVIKSLDEVYSISLGQQSENGRYLAAYAFSNQEDLNSGPRTLIYDFENCNENACNPVEGIGYPVWSPNGKNVLFLPFNNFDFPTRIADGRIWHSGVRAPFNLHLGLEVMPPEDEQDFPQYDTDIIGFGYAPIWLDNDTFGYIETDVERTESSFIVQSVNNLDRIQTMFTAFEIQSILPNNGNINRNIQLSYVVPMPNDANQLLVMVSGRGASGHLVLYDLLTDEFTYVMRVANSFQHLSAISPDGAYIAAATNNDDDLLMRQVGIFNTTTGEIQYGFLKTTSFFLGLSMDWSSDGEWLAVESALNIVQLFHMPTGQKYLLEHPHRSCDAISWLDQLSSN